MSFRVYFALSSGLSRPITAAKGTLATIIKHVKFVESTLGYETEQYKDNPKHWKTTTPKEGVSDETFCDVAERHNYLVRYYYDEFEKLSKEPPKNGEIITPEDAKQFWHGLQMIEVPLERWTADYYKARMDALYAAMRGQDGEGATFDAKPLTTEQAAAVIWLFDQYLDKHDLRLEVPQGRDSLYTSDDYLWCDKCGAIHQDDVAGKMRRCRKRGGCSLRRDYGDR